MGVDKQVTAELGQFDSLAMTQTPGTVQTIANGNTIQTNIGIVRVTAGGAVTGVILTPGARGGQIVTIIHEGAAANTITMAAAGTSNVAAGATNSMSGLAAHTYVWDSITALWYQTGVAVN